MVDFMEKRIELYTREETHKTIFLYIQPQWFSGSMLVFQGVSRSMTRGAHVKVDRLRDCGLRMLVLSGCRRNQSK